jgi:hypothetical protein
MLEHADLRVRTLVEAGDRLVVSDPSESARPAGADDA